MINSNLGGALDADQHARSVALNPALSFVVQAPAGSGKTELLIQRLLAVLAQAEHPSEVLAITFTNKAAGEMRERLFSALQSAQTPATTTLRPVEQVRRALAEAVLQRDRALGWKLMERPEAVLIDTFDAFCARLAARAPLRQVAASAALAPIEPALNAVYREAARSALFDDDIRHESQTLLTLAANRVDDVVTLIADLLARRAQWLGEAVDTSDAAVARLTAVLVAQIEKRLAHLARLAQVAQVTQQAQEAQEVQGAQGAGVHHPRLGGEIVALARFTATVFACDGREARAAERVALAQAWPPGAQIEHIALWRTLADLILTSGGQLRNPRGINVKAGFPVAKDGKDATYARIAADERAAMKARMVALLPELEGHSAFISALAQARGLPSLAAIAEHEIALKATLVVLRLSAAYLSLLMRERGVTDFSGVMLAALTALRDAREDVLAGLDAKLKHILVDEVQDTNPAQFDLLRMLTADWSNGDGRTLFLVGDPMQSIYGFRDADVSLFLQAQARGVGEVALTALTLTANYRSQPQIVEWVNRDMARVFASGERDVVADDARVKFVSAIATRPAASAADGVAERAFASDGDEATALAAAIAELRATEPAASIAVLVRGRAHATALIAQFSARAIAFTAREFADWSARETVRDLLSLTYAIAQPNDRLPLFAVLRSPWVGLRLATLAALATALDSARRAAAPPPRDSTPAPAAHWLRDDQPWLASVADSDERARIAHAAAAFAVADAHAWMSSLSERVEAAWHALGGPAHLADGAGAGEGARDEVTAFFAWLGRVSQGGMLPPRHELEMLLANERQSFSSSAQTAGTAERGTVEILTIHKAKGLEWDHVFLIGADRPVRADTRALARWRFVSSESAHAPRTVVIAARDSRRRSAGSVFDFVSDQARQARMDEGKRLLYVAATRARRTLTLSRCCGHSAPSAGSFAAMLGLLPEASLLVNEAVAPRRLLLEASLKRAPVPTAWDNARLVLPAYRAALEAAQTAVPLEQRDARAQGVVGHLLFEGFAALHARGGRFAPNGAAIERQLLKEGATPAAARAFAERIVEWFASAPQRPNVQFLFSATHRQRNSEWSLPATANDATAVRLDYTFVTADHVRWVIDFKFTEPGAGADEAAWRAAQVAQYRAQLAHYVARVRALHAFDETAAAPGSRDAPVIRAALYFPWIDRLDEVAL